MERPLGYSFHVPLSTDMLLAEVASGTFAFKNQVKPASVKALWEKLGFLVAETLKQQKGVLLPSLGNFRVGPVVGENSRKVRPSFRLLEGRYGAISQEQSKYIVGGKAPIVQPNYGLLSSSANVHRGIGQRLTAELLNRLGVHILSERPIKVDMPCVGKLLTNRSGRIEFVFDPLLLDFFVSQREMVVREMDYSADDYEVHKALQQVNLADPPLIKSPRLNSRPVSALSGVSKGVKMPRNPKGLYTQGLREVLQLCNAADRIGSGCVTRERLQAWLTQECRPVLALLDGGTLMDLLDRHTYGKKVQQILYRQFLYALDEALGAAGASPRDRVPSPVPSPRPTGDSIPPAQLGAAPEGAAGHAPAAPSPMVNSWVGQPAVTASQGPDPEAYAHYVQNQLSPRSRADYDAFNRIHFERLHSARGVRRKQEVKRAVTPKVGEEPRNVEEYDAVRSASPQGARGRLPTPLWPSQQQQQQRWVATPNALGLIPEAPPRPFKHMYESPEVLRLMHPDEPSHTPSPQQQQQHQTYQAYSAPPHLPQQPGGLQGQGQGQLRGQGQGQSEGQGQLGAHGQWLAVPQGQQGQGQGRAGQQGQVHFEEQERPGEQLGGQGQQRWGQAADVQGQRQAQARQPAEWQPREQQQQQRGQANDILAPPAPSPSTHTGSPMPHEWQASEKPQERYSILAPSYTPPGSAIASAALVEGQQQRERQQQRQPERRVSYNILAPPPAPPASRDKGETPLSQYDISRELDKGVKAKLKAEYAAQLHEGWDKQIREKDELQEVLQQKEQRWPYGPVGVPMDKRPVSAISRPFSPHRSPRGAAGGP